MRTKPLAAALVGAAACLLLMSSGTSGQSTIENSRQTRWDYKVVHINSLAPGVKNLRDTDAVIASVQDSFNRLGEEGWELCLEINGGVVLKRPQ